MTGAFTTREALVKLNGGSFRDKRARVINADAAVWLQNSTEMFDAVIIDFPDPSSFALGKLYSVPFYDLVKKHLAVNGLVPGETLPLYVRDNIAADLHRAEIKVTNYARLFGSDGDTVFLQHTASAAPIMIEGVETLVLCLGHTPVSDLEADLRGMVELHMA
eukprot:gene51854-70659_t